MSAVRIGRAFSPEYRLGNPTQGCALGWYGTGPLALRIRRGLHAKGATSSFFRAKGASPYQPGASPQDCRPPNIPRAKGPAYTSEGQRPSTGASPQEWDHPTKHRAESPIQGVAGCAVAHQFRGVTRMVPQVITRRSPAAGFHRRSSRQGFLDYSNRRRSRVTEDSSATANSAAGSVSTPRSQGMATVKESLTVPMEHRRRGTAEDSSVVQRAGGNDVLGLRGIRIGRTFSPREIVSTGFLGRCPRLVWRWAFGPEAQAAPTAHQTAPTARFHASLGQRPRNATPTRIEG